MTGDKIYFAEMKNQQQTDQTKTSQPTNKPQTTKNLWTL